MKTIYTNGNIITLGEDANAVVIEDDLIVGVGDYHKLYEEGMRVVDLKGCTLMPSFIDAHSHLSGYATSLLQVSLDHCQSIDDVIQKIKDYIKKNHKDNQFVMCKGYDHHQLKEKRHILKKELDEISSVIPIIIQHQTGHCGVMNSAAFKLLHISQDTIMPEGGKIRYEDGFLEETAFTYYLQKAPMPSLKELKKAYQKAQYVYASYGITTVQDGMIVDGLKDIYDMLLKNDVFYLDVVGYVGFEARQFMKTFYQYIKHYHLHFKIGGYKMFLDGSPQNKTAWTIEPYQDGTYGYPTLTNEQLQKYLKQAIQENLQVLVHCNGDQAIQHYLDQYEKVCQQDIRPVIIHAQMMRPSQMQQAHQLHMIPSFYVAHVYYFGDIHKENMGNKRAQSISPLASALKHHLLFTIHQDSPVLEPDMLKSLWIATQRQTKSGDILGVEECISPLEALKAMTINAAYQYHEENMKGSLKVGKKADMVILSDNPLTIPSQHIKDIKVITTIKDGKMIYQKNIF